MLRNLFLLRHTESLSFFELPLVKSAGGRYLMLARSA